MFALTVGLAAAILLWIASGRGYPPWIVFLPPALAALLVATSLRPIEPTRPDSGYGQLRITLSDIRVEGGTAVAIGGGLADHLVISDPDGLAFPPAAISLKAVGGGIRITAGPGLGQRYVVRVEEEDERRLLIGARTVGEPVRRCSALDPVSCGPVQWLLGLRAEVPPVAVCPASGYRAGAVERPAARRLYAGPGFLWRSATTGACQPIDPRRPLFTLSASGAIHEVDPAAGSRMHVAGKPFRLIVHELLPEGRPADPELSPAPRRMPVRLDLKVAREDSGAILLKPAPDQPFVVARPSGRLRPDIRLAGRDGLTFGSSADSPVAAFPLLGTRVASGLLSLSVRLPSGDGAPLTLTGPPDASLEGSRLTTGPEDVRLGFRLERASFKTEPLKPLRWFALLALGIAVLASARLRLADSTAAVLFGVLDVLLTARLLIAVEGAISSPLTATAGYPADAVVALVAVPVALRTAWPQAAGEALAGRVPLIAWSVAVGAALLAIMLRLNPGDTALAGALLLLLTGSVAGRFQAPLRAVIGRICVHLADNVAWASRKPIVATLAVSVALIILRFVIRERLPLPFPSVRLSSALLFLPASLLWAAFLLHLPKTCNSIAALLVFLFLGVGAASFAASDSGFAVIAWPIAIGAALAWALGAHAPRWGADATISALIALVAVSALVLYLNGLDLVAAAAAIIVVLGMIDVLARRSSALLPFPALAILFGALAVGISPALPFDSAAIGLADDDPGRNVARLLAAFAPARLAANGNSAAVEFASVLSVMKDYAAGGGVWGQGFLQMPAPVPAIRETHLSDHAAGVHVFWPHGVAGAAALALLYGAVCVLAAARARPDMSVRGWFGTLAAFGFSLVSIYMLLANAGWVPFIGRNMFLLSPLSGSDVLEGSLLFLIMAHCLPRPIAGRPR